MAELKGILSAWRRARTPSRAIRSATSRGEGIVLEKRSDLLSHNISSAMAAQASASARA